VGHGADAAFVNGVHEDAALFEAGADIDGGDTGGGDVEDDDVTIDLIRIDLHAGNVGEAFGEEARVGVIEDEFGRRLIERDHSGGGENSGLPHTAAETLPIEARFGHKIGRAGENGANRSTESFG
jgi:hypothetical protein